MKKQLLALMAVAGLGLAMTSPAHAEQRISIHELHNFVNKTENALNARNVGATRDYLQRVTSENATFTHNISRYHAYGMQPVWYGDPLYGQYYRYPLAGAYQQVSTRDVGKWEEIAMVERKQRSIPGYRAALDVTDSVINPYGTAAVVDIDFKEYSLAYNPYHPTLTSSIMHSNSRCKMYVSKTDDNNLFLNRMDCNTNTNLNY